VCYPAAAGELTARPLAKLGGGHGGRKGTGRKWKEGGGEGRGWREGEKGRHRFESPL